MDYPEWMYSGMVGLFKNEFHRSLSAEHLKSRNGTKRIE